MTAIQFSPKEHEIIARYVASLRKPRRKTKKPVIIALVGLVGSGKRMVASALAKGIGAAIVSADELRNTLRNKKTDFHNVRELSFVIANLLVSAGNSVIINSDFIDPKKVRRLNQIARRHRIAVLYIRAVCNADVMMGRIVQERYGPPKRDLFAGATSAWRGENKAVVVKLREMWRRTPHHYDWVNEDGGKWVLKKLPKVFAEIDTTDERKIKSQIQSIIQKLK